MAGRLNTELLSSVAEQLMTGEVVVVRGHTLPVQRTSRHGLRWVNFGLDGGEYQAIEQNAEKPSRWGELARKGHRVVQFRDAKTGRYIGVSVDGKITTYDRR